MNRNVVISGVVVVLIVAAGFFFLTRNNVPTTSESQNPQVANTSQPTSTPNAMTGIDASPSASTTGSETNTSVKSFTVTGSNFKFDISTLTVKKGDKVQIVFKNSGGFHNLVLDEFGANTMKPIPSGQSATVEFTADKTGSFEYYCSVMNHRQMGMKGTLIVQ